MKRTATLTVLAVYLIQNVHTQQNSNIWRNETYGTEWVAFVDDNGKPHYVNLTLTEAEVKAQIKDTRRILANEVPSYWLYTRTTITKPEKYLSANNLNNFIPGAKIYVIIHGWLSNKDAKMIQSIKNGILRKTKNNVNVIAVDWRNVQSWVYTYSADKTLDVAQHVKNFIIDLSKIQKYKISNTDVEFIGHSLGAHVSGLAGELLQKENFKVSRVTGLDPAAPFFETFRVVVFPGITKRAAAFVDIIHTSTTYLGIAKAIGHADFYPNGGAIQLACCKGKTTFAGITGGRTSTSTGSVGITVIPKYAVKQGGPTTYLCFDVKTRHLSYTGHEAFNLTGETWVMFTSAYSSGYNFVKNIITFVEKCNANC